MKSIVTTTAALIVIAAACSDSVAPPRREPLTGQVTLVAPSAGARFAQNDTTIGCVAHPFRGSGFRMSFDWDDVPGATRYTLYLKQSTAIYPLINQTVWVSQHEITSCNAFVIDRNLDDWEWTVAAIKDTPGSLEPDTLWSEHRRYGFMPCRLANGWPCYAPADSTLPPP